LSELNVNSTQKETYLRVEGDSKRGQANVCEKRTLKSVMNRRSWGLFLASISVPLKRENHFSFPNHTVTSTVRLKSLV
jgi:hypothetical protein